MKTLAVLVSAAATLGFLPAVAGDVSFSYAAHELSSASSVAGLYDRMAEKASRACALYENSGLFGVQYQRLCAAGLIDDLVAQIGDGDLTALHEARHARFAENR